MGSICTKGDTSTNVFFGGFHVSLGSEGYICSRSQGHVKGSESTGQEPSYFTLDYRFLGLEIGQVLGVNRRMGRLEDHLLT